MSAPAATEPAQAAGNIDKAGDYIRQQYQVPAHVNVRIQFTGDGKRTRKGTIVGFDGPYIVVRFDGDTDTSRLHPKWRVAYLKNPIWTDERKPGRGWVPRPRGVDRFRDAAGEHWAAIEAGGMWFRCEETDRGARYWTGVLSFGPLGEAAVVDGTAPPVHRLVRRGANELRVAEAAAVTVARVTRALAILGDDVRPSEADVGRLRVQHPHDSLAHLATLACPPTTKDAVAGRLRRLLLHADQVAQELGVPGTAVDPPVVVAEALFASRLDPGDAATPDQVYQAVENTLAAIGLDSCVAVVATEFGDHPEQSVRRMCWCRQVTARVYLGQQFHETQCAEATS